jgi:hypothetical protein
LPVSGYLGCRNVKHNGRLRNYAVIRFDDGVVRHFLPFPASRSRWSTDTLPCDAA